MTCRRIDDHNYWSGQHHALLLFCAKKALRVFQHHNTVEIDELVNVGWIRTLRRRDMDNLRGCASFTILHMLEYLSYTVVGATKFKREKYGAKAMIELGEGFDVASNDFNPLEIAIRREACEVKS